MEFRFTLRDNGMRAAFQLLHMVLEVCASLVLLKKKKNSLQSTVAHMRYGPMAMIYINITLLT